MTQDRRIRKSQQAIKTAFIDLLHKYDFNDVTVQQITDLADINRGTFYTHYLDKYDLLDKMEDEPLYLLSSCSPPSLPIGFIELEIHNNVIGSLIFMRFIIHRMLLYKTQ